MTRGSGTGRSIRSPPSSSPVRASPTSSTRSTSPAIRHCPSPCAAAATTSQAAPSSTLDSSATSLKCAPSEWTPNNRRLRADGGAQIGDVDGETQAFGSLPLGLVSETGIAGLTLAGGLGWMRRKHGLSCDNLVSADVVLADGRYVHADNQENQDPFWALRGGTAGNKPSGAVFHGRLFYELRGPDDARATAASFGENLQRLVQIKRKYDPTNLFRSRRGLVD